MTGKTNDLPTRVKGSKREPPQSEGFHEGITTDENGWTEGPSSKPLRNESAEKVGTAKWEIVVKRSKECDAWTTGVCWK